MEQPKMKSSSHGGRFWLRAIVAFNLYLAIRFVWKELYSGEEWISKENDFRLQWIHEYSTQGRRVNTLEYERAWEFYTVVTNKPINISLAFGNILMCGVLMFGWEKGITWCLRTWLVFTWVLTLYLLSLIVTVWAIPSLRRKLTTILLAVVVSCNLLEIWLVRRHMERQKTEAEGDEEEQGESSNAECAV